MIYFYAACVLSLIGTFTARQVKRALKEEEMTGAHFALYAVKDIGEVALFAFALIELLDYVRGGVE